MLIEAGLISREDVDSAVVEAAQQGQRLGDYLAERGLVSAENLARTLSVQLNVPFFDLKRHAVRPQAVALVPEDYARRHDLVPVDIIGDSLIVVMADPGNVQVLEDMESRVRMPVQPAVGVTNDIRDAINRNYRASTEIEAQVSRVAVPTEEEDAAESLARAGVEQTPIVRTVDLLIEQAVRDRASDVHLEPQQDRLRVRYRIDGLLQDAQTLPLNLHHQLVSRVKVLAGMNIAERRRPQDGQFSFEMEDRQVDIRVSTSDAIHGELLVLRVLDKALSIMELTELGFQPQTLETYARMLRTPFGMIFAGGPTGSGKTTTLYASVNQLDKGSRNIVTIEDPVEYQFEGINQIQVNPKADITFAGGLRSIMRLDPDVILVGEVRDTDTARIAIQASLTGHLVLSSIHSNDAVGVLYRLMDLGVEPHVISSALTGVVSQRMVRLICPRCRSLAEPSAEERAAYEQQLGEPPGKLYRGAGCVFCADSGFLGRTAVFEALVLSERLRRAFLDGATPAEMRRQAISEGMIAVSADAMLKAKSGLTTVAEGIRAVYSID
ncbi:MAG: GspE/PulE family protein [Dehalococcoidia bacterium]